MRRAEAMRLRSGESRWRLEARPLSIRAPCALGCEGIQVGLG